ITTGTTDFTDVTNQGDLSVNLGTNIAVFGTGFLNNGTTLLNPQNSSANSTIIFEESGTLGGSGEIQMRTAADNSQINSAVGVTINHPASHTIRGVGRVNAAMNNAGVIAADAAAANPAQNILELELNDKTNSGLLEARTGSVLQIEGITIDQTGGGNIEANDGVVSFFLGGTAVLGGDITSSGSGSVGIRGSSTTTLQNVDLDANFFVDAGSNMVIDGTSLTNNGTITVNNQNSSANGVITTDDIVTIDGSGAIIMRTNFDNSQITTSGSGQVTNGANHTIAGTGTLNGDFVNNGLISADVGVALSGPSLILDGGPYANNALMTAENASTLDVRDVTITQDPDAAIEANDGGLVTLGASSRYENGTFRSVGSGTFRNAGSGVREVSGVTLDGLLQVEAGSTTTVDAAGLVNNGLIVINRNNSSADGIFQLADASVSGVGEIQLLTGSTNSFVRTAPGTSGTIGAGQLVRGAGVIDGALTNNGIIAADTSVSISGNELFLNTNDKINNNQLRAEDASIISSSNITIDQTAGGSMRAASGGKVELNSGSTILGGTMGADAGGSWEVSGGRSDIDDVPLDGVGAVFAGTTLGVLNDTLSNAGVITVNPNNSSADGIILVTQDTTITGGGEIDFFTSGIGNSRISAEGGLDPLPVVTNAAGHTLSGFATIQVPMVNEGTIVAGRPFNDFTVQQLLTLAPSSNFNVTIGFNAQNGQLDPSGVNGVVSLDGTLNVAVADGQVLANGRNHVIVDGPYTGTFDTENIASDGQLVTRVRYETNQVVLRTRCLADTNLDGSVDPADFNAWVNAFNNGDTVADQNLDGLITPADFNAWVLNFNSGC
ncbi:MAG: GC-type dockerin domain-anchored protein, partial [Planctomycetota bacterium]